MLQCHLLIGTEQPEGLLGFLARHLGELLADACACSPASIALRVDLAPPSRYYLGGHLQGCLPPCLLTIHHGPAFPLAAARGELSEKLRQLLAATLGLPVLSSQIRFAPAAAAVLAPTV